MTPKTLRKCPRKVALLLLLETYAIRGKSPEYSYGYDSTPDFFKLLMCRDEFTRLMGLLSESDFVHLETYHAGYSLDFWTELQLTKKSRQWIYKEFKDTAIGGFGKWKDLIVKSLSGENVLLNLKTPD